MKEERLKMKIIELSGLPGCGKSTIVGEVNERFQFKLLTVQNLENDRKNFLNNRYLQFLIDLFYFRNLKINLLIILYTFSYKVNRERISWISNFITYNAKLLEKMNKKRDTYLILDQGIIVLLTAVPHENLIKKNLVFKSLIKALKQKYKDIMFINCQLEKQAVTQRIRMRNQKGHRFDRLSDEMLEKMLDIKTHNLEIVQKYFQENLDVLTIDMSLGKEVNVEKILKFII